jgi:probable O-glycosylation ligase (exosortase A-associated)
MNPHRLSWTAQESPVAMYVAIATLAGLPFTRERDRPPLSRETILLALLWIVYTVSTFFALNPADAWEQWDTVSKILLLTFVTIILCLDKARLHYLMLAIALSLGFYGFKGGIFGITTGGAYRVYGPRGSFIEENNALAMALLMAIPLLFYLAGEEKRRWLKLTLVATFALSLMSIILTYSRGGFIGLVAVAFMFFLKLKRRLLWASIGLVVVVLSLPLIPQRWYDRISSIQDYRYDRSVQGRFNAWGFAINVARVRPLNGGGFEVFHPEFFKILAPNPDDYHDAHSIYFEVLGEHGLPGLALFSALLASCFLSLRKLRRSYGRVPSLEWVGRCADMLSISLVAYCVSGAFLGLAYFDLYYHLVAMVIILKEVARREYLALLEREAEESAELVAT